MWYEKPDICHYQDGEEVCKCKQHDLFRDICVGWTSIEQCL